MNYDSKIQKLENDIKRNENKKPTLYRVTNIKRFGKDFWIQGRKMKKDGTDTKLKPVCLFDEWKKA